MSRPRRTHCPCGVELTDENRALTTDGRSRGLCLACHKAYHAQSGRERRERMRKRRTPISAEVSGERGGMVCLQRHGREFYAAMGRKSAAKRKERTP